MIFEITKTNKKIKCSKITSNNIWFSFDLVILNISDSYWIPYLFYIIIAVLDTIEIVVIKYIILFQVPISALSQEIPLFMNDVNELNNKPICMILIKVP